jgi:mannose-6-phosphate isomerase-like protein (cupin superfamily)
MTIALRADDGDALSDRAERTVRALCEHPLVDVTWSRYEPGEQGPDPHIHREHVDAFYVVEGELEFGVGPAIERVHAPAGTFVLVPPGVLHTFANRSDATVRWLNLHAPSTGFIASMRGEQDGFDSFDAGEGDGLPAALATARSAGDGTWTERAGVVAVELGRERQLALTELELSPGAAHDSGAHADALSSYFVIAGEAELVACGERVRMGIRMWASVPPGVDHSCSNPGGGPARVLHVLAPAAAS